MSVPEALDKVANETAAINSPEADSGTKRKSSKDVTHNGNENYDAENSPRKRVKSEEPVASIKDETDLDVAIKIKAEPVDDAEDKENPAAEPTSTDPTIQIKTEPADNGIPPAATMIKTEPTNKNAPGAVDDSSVSSSSTRTSCRFGIRCYRRNPAHRSAEAHPGDQDYRRPDFPAPPLGTPACPYGNSCYRRNPVHFQDYSHPADFNSAQNIRNRLRQRRAQRQNDDDSCTDEEDEPFGGDNDKDADYRPGADIDEDEDDDLEFDSQRISGDDFD
ncbi:aprataxin and PNK-like factor isoform X1 [Drosophila teissieri]|uniref:aprataxin and PNK-like factor isoform X1 n=1 Tax=Drosophila teissieri TaxID=7243 RepID=UPI001CBA0B0E|nr:aprataxin and PNK-like factor isoform X1 [Drosophila teissieri]